MIQTFYNNNKISREFIYLFLFQLLAEINPRFIPKLGLVNK